MSGLPFLIPTFFIVITMQRSAFFSALGLALALCLTPLCVQAGEGHDHGEAPAATASPISPRFAAASDLFELVGVLDGQRLALYLDRAGDNSPAKEAQLELDIGGARVPVTRVADGEFEAVLSVPLAEGVSPVTATVVAGNDSDLLAGEIDIHTDAHAHAEPMGWHRTTLVGGAAAAVLLVLAALWGLRRRRAARPVHAGGAA